MPLSKTSRACIFNTSIAWASTAPSANLADISQADTKRDRRQTDTHTQRERERERARWRRIITHDRARRSFIDLLCGFTWLGLPATGPHYDCAVCGLDEPAAFNLNSWNGITSRVDSVKRRRSLIKRPCHQAKTTTFLSQQPPSDDTRTPTYVDRMLRVIFAAEVDCTGHTTHGKWILMNRHASAIRKGRHFDTGVTAAIFLEGKKMRAAAFSCSSSPSVWHFLYL